jgi:lysophospholipase L1-like esterase
VVLHACIPELEKGRYNSLGQKIIEFAHQNHINVIEDLHLLRPGDYTDQLHINSQGQKKLANAIFQEYQELNLLSHRYGD